MNGVIVQLNDAEGFATATQSLWINSVARKGMGELAREAIAVSSNWKQTTASATLLFDTALRNWSLRTGREVPVDIAAAKTAFGDEVGKSDWQTAIPSHLRPALRAEEKLGWLRELSYSKEYGKMMRMAAAAVLREPMNRTLLTGLVKMAIGPHILHRMKRIVGTR